MRKLSVLTRTQLTNLAFTFCYDCWYHLWFKQAFQQSLYWFLVLLVRFMGLSGCQRLIQNFCQTFHLLCNQKCRYHHLVHLLRSWEGFTQTYCCCILTETSKLLKRPRILCCVKRRLYLDSLWWSYHLFLFVRCLYLLLSFRMPMRLLQVLGSKGISSLVALKQTLKCNFYFEIAWQNRILALGCLKKGQYLMALDIDLVAYIA